MISDKRASVSTPTRMVAGRRVQERIVVDPSDVTLVLFIAMPVLLEFRRDLEVPGPRWPSGHWSWALVGAFQLPSPCAPHASRQPLPCRHKLSIMVTQALTTWHPVDQHPTSSARRQLESTDVFGKLRLPWKTADALRACRDIICNIQRDELVSIVFASRDASHSDGLVPKLIVSASIANPCGKELVETGNTRTRRVHRKPVGHFEIRPSVLLGHGRIAVPGCTVIGNY